MQLRTALKLAIAETRRSRRTLAFCVLSVALGVLALTAGRTVTDSLNAALSGQAKQVLGADLVIASSRPLEEGTARSMTEELKSRGAQSATGTRFFSMLSSVDPRTERENQFVRVRSVGTGFPFYGDVETIPAGQWGLLSQGGVLVDESVMQALSLSPGDAVRFGDLETRVLGSVVKRAGSPTAEFSMAPFLYLHESQVAKTGLLKTGSRVQYERVFRLPPELSAEAWKEEHWSAALNADLQIKTSKEAASNVRRFFTRLSKFLTVVALITLFLAALGIGSAMNSFMASRLNHAVILRCLGARSRDLWLIYGCVALIIALLGSALGAALGAGLPALLSGRLSSLAAGFLPADIPIVFSPRAVVHGLSAGLVASLGFMLVPIWRVADVSPLRILGRDASPEGRPRRSSRHAVLIAVLVIVVSAFTLASAQTDSLTTGVGFTLVIGVSLAMLLGLSQLLIGAARLFAPGIASFHLRQGLKNLHRPGNQTTAVMVSVGIGFLLISCIVTLQNSLEQVLQVESQEDLPNLFVVDVQPEQQADLSRLLSKHEATQVDQSPMISARIRSVGGKRIDKSDVERDESKRGWNDRMRTREYFISYRDHLIETEEVVAGRFWEPDTTEQEVSLSEQLAKNIGAKIGDVITLSIEGLPFEATITSFRKIEWQRMRANVMILLSPGEISQAPHTLVSTARIEDRSRRLSFQSEIVSTHPNVTVVDVTQATETALLILSRVSIAFRVLGLIALTTGVMILGGAIAASRFARRKESTLLKVLGASRADLRKILSTEQLFLSGLGVTSGWLLLELVARVGIPLSFDAAVEVPYMMLLWIAGGSIALSALMGVLVSHQVSTDKPLEVLRET